MTRGEARTNFFLTTTGPYRVGTWTARWGGTGSWYADDGGLWDRSPGHLSERAGELLPARSL
jgi:hypothetical protein